MNKKRKKKEEPDQGVPVHSGNRKGEETIEREGKEPGRYDEGNAGANRPTGKSTSRDSTGVNPKEPIDPNSPTLIPD
jgi:hypothetical protein